MVLSFDLNPGLSEVVVETGGILRSEPFQVTLETHAPGIFVNEDTSDGVGLFFNVTTIVTRESPVEPGDILSLTAVGLGPTDPPVAAGDPAPFSPIAVTVTTPTITIGEGTGTAAVTTPKQQSFVVRVISAVLPAGFAEGRYQVTFSVPEGLPDGLLPLTLEIGGQVSEPVLLPVGQSAVPAIQSLVSAASFGFDGMTAPGSIVSMFADNILTEQNLTLFPDTEFQDLAVTFGGIPAPLFAVVPSVGQINLFAPSELPESGNVEVLLTTSAGTSQAFSVEMAPATPGIFPVNDPSDPAKRSSAVTLANTRWLAIPDSTSAALGLPTNCVEAGISPASFCGRPALPMIPW